MIASACKIYFDTYQWANLLAGRVRSNLLHTYTPILRLLSSLRLYLKYRFILMEEDQLAQKYFYPNRNASGKTLKICQELYVKYPLHGSGWNYCFVKGNKQLDILFPWQHWYPFLLLHGEHKIIVICAIFKLYILQLVLKLRNANWTGNSLVGCQLQMWWFKFQLAMQISFLSCGPDMI